MYRKQHKSEEKEKKKRGTIMGKDDIGGEDMRIRGIRESREVEVCVRRRR